MFEDSNSHPWDTRSLSCASTADQSMDRPPCVILGTPEKILYSSAPIAPPPYRLSNRYFAPAIRGFTGKPGGCERQRLSPNNEFTCRRLLRDITPRGHVDSRRSGATSGSAADGGPDDSRVRPLSRRRDPGKVLRLQQFPHATDDETPPEQGDRDQQQQPHVEPRVARS